MSDNSNNNNNSVYRYLVVDSGPIIRLTGSSLWQKATDFYTVPAVIHEIRDSQARQALQQLPFPLHTREPTPQAIQAVVDFARQTGDYHSLSAVDIQVLALLYDLEREAVGTLEHVRTTPKRPLGQNIQMMNHEAKNDPEYDIVEDKGGDGSVFSEDEKREIEDSADQVDAKEPTQTLQKPQSWAMMVNPLQASKEIPVVAERDEESTVPTEQAPPVVAMSKLEIEHGQFSDAEEESSEYDDYDKEISDEECDVYIRDPEELKQQNLEKDLQSDFPSLAAASLVPYDGSSSDEEEANNDLETRERLEQERKQNSLRPVSNSGKLYNTLGKYGKLLSDNKKKAPSNGKSEPKQTLTTDSSDATTDAIPTDALEHKSRIVGGFGLVGDDVDDDGEGWITNTREIQAMKAVGALNPSTKPSDFDRGSNQQGPPIHQRAACATTDFAMQNVILQMNLELLSVDGVKVRKLKSWVTRCGACFKVYTSQENLGPLGKRLFCERCGSDMMQRIAASVDGKTGRLRLHLSKRYKHNLRGTKYSLPKPGSGNRFQGDLLLREDQLMVGAWSQKVKMRSGGKAKSSAQSMFGRDIASNVGCNSHSMSTDDIRVGFGRRNPNAAKGRERRGKKKKSSDKACGLRRY